MESLASYPAVLAVASEFAGRQQALVDLAIQIQQIPAPTFGEQRRAAWVAQQFHELGMADVQIDTLPNVYARVAGKMAKPVLLVSAHTDTVFPQETDLSVRTDPVLSRIYGPGIGDNATGVAGLLMLAQALQALPPPPVDIWLVANCGEEGLGNLRGMHGAVGHLTQRIGASIVIEGTGLKRVVHRALGSRRFHISVRSPGGHSWSDFGSPSAVHILAQLAADITQLAPPASPRTTFNIGRINGGTSVNTIAQFAECELDLRSEDATVLDAMIGQTQAIIARRRQVWQGQDVHINVKVVGDRPGGQIEEGHPLVAAAKASLAACGITVQSNLSISSTDANVPLSRGIPAICIGVTEGGNAHRVEEWIHTDLLPTGMRHLLQLTWWAAAWLGGEIG
jgi:acetylornithine deacetylase/succinyl-diaminopimelate desuccinylase-like protein